MLLHIHHAWHRLAHSQLWFCFSQYHRTSKLLFCVWMTLWQYESLYHLYLVSSSCSYNRVLANLIGRHYHLCFVERYGQYRQQVFVARGNRFATLINKKKCLQINNVEVIMSQTGGVVVGAVRRLDSNPLVPTIYKGFEVRNHLRVHDSTKPKCCTHAGIGLWVGNTTCFPPMQWLLCSGVGAIFFTSIYPL